MGDGKRGSWADCLLIIAGFGLCRAWIVFCLSASVASMDQRGDWIFLLAGAGAAALAAFVMTRCAGSLARMHEHLSDYMVGLIAASIVCVPCASWLDSAPLLLLGLMAGGAGSGLLQVMWGERFAAQELYESLICAPAAAIVTGVMLSLSASDNQLVFVVLPLLSVLLLGLECRRCRVDWKTGLPEGAVEEEEPSASAAGEPVQLGADTAKLMVTVLMFSFLVRTFDAFPLAGNDPLAFLGGGSMSLVLVGALFLVVARPIKDRANVTFLYRLSLPITIAGFAATVLLVDQRTPLLFIVVSIGYELFDILSWVLFSEIARRHDRRWAPYVFGIGVACMYTGMAAGYMLSAVLHPFVESGAIRISSVVLIAVLCLVVIAFLVLPESAVHSLLAIKKPDRKSEEPAEKTGAATVSLSLEERCAGVARQYGLTPREQEVLVFLARGRTLSIVARDLYIAKNTARTHIEKIYQKTDIHRQQDLIDFVEAWEEEPRDE